MISGGQEWYALAAHKSSPSVRGTATKGLTSRLPALVDERGDN
jgi:hypothetical protein